MVSDIAVAVAAGVGAFVAWRGLGAWRQQLKGANEYELAKRILKCTYQLRDSISALRHPFMPASEMPQPPEDEGARMTHDERGFYGTVKAYERRWEAVRLCRNEMRAEVLEAQVLWGDDFDKTVKPIFDLLQELQIDLETHIRSINPRSSEERRAAADRQRTTKREALFNQSTSKLDQFASDLENAVKAVEAEMRRRIHAS